MTNSEKLALLNGYRNAEGKTSFADFRPARHQAMLDAYVAASQPAEVEPAKAEKSEVSQEEIKDVINSNDFANKEVAEAFKGKKQPSYKHLMAKSGKTSLVDKPVGFAHQFLTQHPELSRKEAVAALVEYGVNYATARTQYQRWFSGRK